VGDGHEYVRPVLPILVPAIVCILRAHDGSRNAVLELYQLDLSCTMSLAAISSSPMRMALAFASQCERNGWVLRS
jgi:hypothetical protein